MSAASLVTCHGHPATRRPTPHPWRKSRIGGVRGRRTENANVGPVERVLLPTPPRDVDVEEASVLARYFRDVALHPRLDVGEELQVARAVEQGEIDHWIALLSWPRAAKPILLALRRQFANPEQDEVPAPQLPELLRLARRALAKGRLTRRSAERYGSLARELAAAIRLPDSNRAWMARARRIARKLARKVGAPATDSVTRPACVPCACESMRPVPLAAQYQAYWAEVARTFRVQKDAKARFVNANLRLVVTLARRYSRGPLAFVDLIQEGNLGLIKAVERFDPNLGYRFSTYASWWIRHSLTRGVANTGRAIRLPVHLVDAHHRAERARRELAGRLGRQPTLDEVACESDIRLEKLERIRTLQVGAPLSLDHPVGDDERTSGDWLCDTTTPSPYDCMAVRDSCVQAANLLSTLTPNETRILRLRFGFDDGEERTLAQIGREYGLSRERIRQIQERALDKLRVRLRPRALAD